MLVLVGTRMCTYFCAGTSGISHCRGSSGETGAGAGDVAGGVRRDVGGRGDGLESPAVGIDADIGCLGEGGP